MSRPTKAACVVRLLLPFLVCLSVLAQTNDDATLRAVVEQLVQSATETEREQILAKEKELATPKLIVAFQKYGDSFRERGNHVQALKIYDLGLALAQRIEDRKGQGRVLQRQGFTYNRMGNQDKAREYLQQSLTIARQINDADSIARAYHALGQVALARNSIDEAITNYQQSLQQAEASGDKIGQAMPLLSLAAIYRQQGKYRQALEISYRALRLYEAAGDKEGIGDSFTGIANLHYLLGDREQSLTFAQKGIQMLEEVGDKSGLAAALSAGAMFYAQVQPDKAMEYYRRCLQLYEEINDRPNVAGTLANMGIALSYQNKLPESLEHFERARKLYEEFGDSKGSQLLVTILNNISQVLGKQGRYQEALANAEKTLALAQKINSYASIRTALRDAARSAQALGQNEKAKEYYAAGIKLIEEQLLQNPAGEQQQQTFFSGYITPYFLLTDLLLSQNATAEALALIERAKARVLVNTVQGGRSSIRRSLTLAEQQDEARHRERLVTLNTQLTREAQRAQPNQTRISEIRTQLDKARLEFEALQTQLYAAHPELKVSRGEISPLTVAELATLLDDQTALLEFAIGNDKAWLFLATLREGRPQLQAFPLPLKRTELTAKTEQLRKYLADKDLRYSEAAQSMYDLLLKPVAASLQGKPRLVIVPDGPLWELPWQALMPAPNRFLVEEKTISTAPSLTFLREMMRVREKRTQASGSAQLLVIGNPALESAAAQSKRADLMGDKLEPLPFAEQQAVQLGQMYKTKAKVLIGAAATETQVKAEMPRARILHLATHGVLDDRKPMYSHLVLAQTGTSEKEDGLLEAHELLEMDLQADLAVLSACETGRGKIGAGEGMIGLTWALFVAGVPSSVVSHWKVADKSSAELMLAFHRHLQATKSGGQPVNTKAEALRQAELQMLRNASTRHPFYWAGFTLVGDGK